MSKVVGALSAVGVGAPLMVSNDFNIALWGTFVGTIQLERTFDGLTAEAVWLPCSLSPDGTVASYTTPLSATVREPEAGVFYRWRCTVYTSGTINHRISQ